MMAKQVRPWSTKPEKYQAPRVQTTDGASTSEFHQGQRAALATKSGCMTAIVAFKPSWIESLASRGRPCMVLRHQRPHRCGQHSGLVHTMAGTAINVNDLGKTQDGAILAMG
jgi:hypothetical protein